MTATVTAGKNQYLFPRLVHFSRIAPTKNATIDQISSRKLTCNVEKNSGQR